MPVLNKAGKSLLCRQRTGAEPSVHKDVAAFTRGRSSQESAGTKTLQISCVLVKTGRRGNLCHSEGFVAHPSLSLLLQYCPAAAAAIAFAPPASCCRGPHLLARLCAGSACPSPLRCVGCCHYLGCAVLLLQQDRAFVRCLEDLQSVAPLSPSSGSRVYSTPRPE